MRMQALYLEGKKELAAAGGESPAFDAAQLFQQATGLDRSGVLIHADDECPADAEQRFRAAIRRRADGEPLQYILGAWPFLDRSFAVGPGVLIPREETELLVHEALAFCGDRACTLLDLCAGSGAIAISCACELPRASVTAVEWSPDAFAWLERNNARHGGRVQLRRGDILRPETAAQCPPVDVLLSNPPYIPAAELPGLQREVQREPALALNGGADGLDFYRAILRLWRPRLKPGGLLAVECGIGQSSVLAEWFTRSGLCRVRVVPDFNGIGRVVRGEVPME